MTYCRIVIFSLLIFILAISPFYVMGQRTCGYDQWIEQKRAQDPTFDQRMEEIRREIAQAAQATGAQRTVYRVPVVVHVIYDTPAGDIPDAQVISQIDVLNEDFRKLNADTINTPIPFKPLAADTEIEFCLATLDPDGLPTTGITRTSTTTTTFSGDDMKATATGGIDPWPNTQYMNIWVCTLGGGLLGFATPPGTAGPAEDGVVVGTEYFGRVGNLDPNFDLGRTATHEVGHFMGLDHPWGGGGCSNDDNINDTPMQDGPNFGCQTFPAVSCTDPNGDMFMNYMDYSDDACFTMFTFDQKTVMQGVMAGPRAQLAASTACGPFLFDDAGVTNISGPSGTICGGDIAPTITLINYGNVPLTTVTVNYLLDGNSVGTFLWTGNLDSAETDTLMLPPFTVPPGAHVLTVFTTDPNGASDFDNTNDQMLGNFIALNAAGLALPMVQGFEAISTVPADWDVINPDNSLTWQHTNSAGKNSKSSIFMDNYSYPSIGQADILELPGYDISNINMARLAFDVAYALYTPNGGFSDTLEVYLSDDCGQTFTLAYQKAGNALKTASATTNAFVPTNSQWRREYIPLDAYVGTTYLQVKFRHVTNYENNLYLDNINIIPVYPTSIEADLAAFGLSVFPNPADQQVQVAFEGTVIQETRIQLHDLAGKMIRSQTFTSTPGQNQIEIEVGDLPAGLYLIHLLQEGRSIVRKVQVE